MSTQDDDIIDFDQYFKEKLPKFIQESANEIPLLLRKKKEEYV
jgi:hypothetical protein